MELDRHLARLALHDDGGRRHAGERPHRHSRSSSTPARRTITVPYAYRQLRMWRNTAVASLTPGPERDARAAARSATSGTRTPTTASARRGSSGSRRRRSAASRSSPTTAARRSSTGDGDAQPRHVPRAERRTRVRRRARCSGRGASTTQNPHGTRQHHAAGHAEPVRGHGRTARRAAAAAGRGLGQRPTRRRRRPTITAPPADGVGRQPGHAHGHRDATPAAVSWAASRSRPTAAATWHPRHRDDELVLLLDGPRCPLDDDQGAGDRRQRQHRDPGSAGTSVAVDCPCSLWANHITSPPIADGGDPSPVEVGVKFKSDRVRRDHRHPLLQGRRQHRHAHRAACGPRTDSASPRRPSPVRAAQRLADRRRSPTRSRSRPDTTYVASYSRAERPLLGHAGVLLPVARAGSERRRDRRQPAAARAAQHRHDDQRRLSPTAPAARSRATRYGAANYWVDVRFIADPGARRRSRT